MKYKDLSFTLSGTEIINLYQSLEAGKEYAQEVLQNHLVSLGETTRKNKMTADMIREDISKIEILLEEMEPQFKKSKEEWENFCRCYG